MSKPGPKPMSVMVRGVRYRDVHECAAKLRVALSSVYWAISNGRTDALGLGQDHRSPEALAKLRKQPTAKPLTIGNISFVSMGEVDAFIGRFHGYTRKALAKGRREEVVGQVMKKALEDEREKN